MTTTELPDAHTMADLSIHERISCILAELPAIGKNQRNQQQGFNFRGIDDVLNALNPLLAKYGVYFVPRVVERVTETRATNSGGKMNVVHLHVEYVFFGTKGDHVVATGWGEGTDSGDKATNKAMTCAMKYVLFQTFAISTEEVSKNESDKFTEEAFDAKSEAKAEFYKLFDSDDPKYTAGWSSFKDFDGAHETFAAGVKNMPKDKADALKKWRKEQGYGWPMSHAQYEACIDYIAMDADAKPATDAAENQEQ